MLRIALFPRICSKSGFMWSIGRFSTNRDDVIPKNMLEKVHTATSQPTCGAVYDKKPFKMRLEAGKTYSWCLCGYSKTQPLCDKTHQSPFLRISHRPIFFQVAETKDYWLCNCKQTKHRPFCDGSHKHPDIQALIR